MFKIFLICAQVLFFTTLNQLSANSSSNSDKGHCESKNEIQKYDQWIKDLPNHYLVRQGNAYLMLNSECPIYISIFGSCFSQNPAAPYIIPQVPITNSYVDPYYAEPLNTPGPDGLTNLIYRIDDHEALVTIVAYPPQAAYLGYQSYLFTRIGSYYTGITPPRPRTISPNPERYEIFGSLGNDINNVIVQNQLQYAPWKKAVVVYITTSNQTLAENLKKSAQKYGINKKSIFIEPIGSNVITGNTAEDDDLVTLIRYDLPKSQSAADKWTNNLDENVLVYKIADPTTKVLRYGKNRYTPHKVNSIETKRSLRTALEQLTDLLTNYLSEKQSSPAVSRATIPTTEVNKRGVPFKGLVGSYCIKYGIQCSGDDQDTSTYAAGILKNLGLQETAFIVGINHTIAEINNACYNSVGIYNAQYQEGVGSSSQTNPKAVGFDSGNLTGSALGILRDLNIKIPHSYHQLKKNIEKLYVTALARNINNSTISKASEYCIDLEGVSLIPEYAPITIIERSYIIPGRTAGGNLDYMLYPNIIASEKNFIK